MNDLSIVELRQYTLHPGRRDELIELFDRKFVETQEATGMRILGQFRDLDDPDRFVWMRGFRDMESRGRALTEFYVESETWKVHGPAARATMVDSKNALLLRPVNHDSGFPVTSSKRPPIGAGALPRSRLAATVCTLIEPVTDKFRAFFQDHVIPLLKAAGAAPLAYFETEYAENTFPQLPVRTGEHVFTWFALFANDDAYDTHVEYLHRSVEWREVVRPELQTHLNDAPRQLRLAPTARSLLR
ncbi:NIPSNAP family containing protein [Actinomadura sp. NBRC 104412]|uniref:NIPSNAP family protein n=1 Tax=Actinomadura sp. NBRC 104412 TaxID=3032203 RepID=UPI00249FC01A|nr:NIPSNAP family protein [Actinomadura sp. NBRC 104412]GLZ09458.1 NIPSNAP family containing protein [Actinomadura sp. NBRC 104412]